jgi:Putative MetA-pathway of phenol degradation
VRSALSCAAALLLASLGAATPAHAQLCHELPRLELRPVSHARPGQANDPGAPVRSTAPRAGDGVQLAIGVRLEAATAAIERRPIDYQGSTVHAQASWRAWSARAQASWYRVRDSREVADGAGDVLVSATWLAYQGQRLQAGLTLPLGLPTGDADERLGMGHWMVMPGGFAAAQLAEAVSASVGVSYHRALGQHGGHNHGIGPYVNPMSAEELGFASRLSLRASAPLLLLAETAVAVPMEASTRMVLGVGFALRSQRMSVSVMAQSGALFAPFTARGVLDLAYAF